MMDVLKKIWRWIEHFHTILWLVDTMRGFLAIPFLFATIVAGIAFIQQWPVWILAFIIILGSFFFALLLGYLTRGKIDKQSNIPFKSEETVERTNEQVKIGYAEFIQLFRINDPKNWEPNMQVKHDGIWIVPPSDDADATPNERAALSQHPQKDLSKPALSFPCTLEEVNKFVEFYGMYGYEDQNYLKSLLTMLPSHQKVSNNDIAPIYKAVEYVSNMIGEEKNGNYFPKTRAILRQKACNGELKIYGKRQLANRQSEPHWRYDSILTGISADYWGDHILSGASTIEQPNSNIPHTTITGPNSLEPKGWENSYADLHIKWEDILKLEI